MKTSDEAIAIAKAACLAQGWRWSEPAYTDLDKIADGRIIWWVSSEDPHNLLTRSIAPNYVFQVDAETGEVLSMGSNVR